MMMKAIEAQIMYYGFRHVLTQTLNSYNLHDLVYYLQFIMYQLFKSLKYLHSAELLHRDIKVRMDVECMK